MATSLRALVLEDQPDDFKLLMHELRRAGFDPAGERVETADEFVAHLDPKVDIIFSDYTMPGFNGLEALRLMKRSKIDVPFVFVSGTIGEEIAVAAMQEGAADYLMKDRLARLGPAVKKILAQWKLKEEKQLAEQAAARLAAIVESSSDAIIATTLEGGIVAWNSAAEQLYGYTAAEIVGKDISLLVPTGRRQNDIPEDHHYMAQRLRSGELIEAYETVRVRKNGRRVDVLVSISPIRDAAGVVLGASFIAHDITRRKRAERFLAAEHAVTRILAESRTLEEASTNLLHALADNLRWEAAVLWKVDSQANVLRRMETWHAPWAEAGFLDDLDQQTILEPDVGIVGRAWARGEPVWEPFSATPEDGRTNDTRLRAAISIPMRHQGQMVGAIEFYNPEMQQPDAAMIAALGNIASQITQFSERRQNEVALKASEERYRTLVAATAEIVWGTPASGEFETEQPEWTAFTWQPFDQLRGWGWLNAVHPDDQESTAAAWRAAVEGRTVYEVEHRLRRGDGEYRHMSIRAVPIFEPGGVVREWVGVHTDVTDKIRAEEAQRLLAAVVDSCEDAIICSDLDGTIRSWNGAAQRLFGYRADEIIGKVGLLVPLDLVADTGAKRARVIQGESVPPFESERLRKGGERVPVSVSLSAVRKDGEIVALSTIFRDITDRKRAEAMQSLLAAVIDSSEDAVVSADLDGYVQSWNPAAERLFGYTAAEAFGRTGFLVPPDLIAEARPFNEQIRKGERVPPLETIRLRKGGEPVPVSITWSAVRVGGKVVAKSAIYRDITSQKEAEAQLRKARAEAEQHLARLQVVFASMTEGVMATGHAGNLLEWNQAARHLHGYDDMDEIREPLAWFAAHFELRQPGGLPLALADRPLARVLRGETITAWELDLRNLATGRESVVSYSGAPVRGADGTVELAVLTLHDVTERKRAELELRMFRALIDKTSDGIEVIDPATGQYLDVNERTCVTHGYTRDEMLTLGVPDLDPEVAALSWQTLIDQGRFLQPQLFEGTHRRKDGSTFPVEVSHDSIHLDREYIVAVVRDITKRKEAEEAIRASEERFRAFMDHSPALADIKDEHGRFLYVNAAWRRQFEQEPRDWLGKTNYDYWPRETADVFRASDVQCLARNVPIEVEEPGRTAAGEERTFLVMKVPFLDGGERRIGGMAWDITDRTRAEAALRLRDRAIAAVSQGILISDATRQDTPIVYASPGFQRLTGYHYQELLGRSSRSLLTGTDTDPAACDQIEEAVREGRPCNLELLNYRKDGTPFWDNLTIAPVFDANNTLTHFVGVHSDVTARRQLEEQYRQAQRRLQNVVASSPAVLFTLAFADDRIQGLRWISDNLLGIFGHSSDAALTPGWWSANVHPEDRDRTVSITKVELLRDGDSSHEYRFRRGDGVYRWTRADLRLIRDETGKPIEVVGAWSDISEHKELESQFHQAQKMDAFGQLAGGVAHDFNNLLTIINGYGEIVLNGLAPQDRARGFVKEILNAGERSASLTGQLLAFSRKQVVVLKTVNLNTVVHNTEKMLRRIIGEDIELVTSLAEDIGAVRADVGQLEQVLLNLAVNARDAMPEGGKVIIETRNVELAQDDARHKDDARPGAYVLLSARDTGCGMTDDVKARIFEPFFTTKGVGKGTGLGLATVYGIIKQAEGYIEVHSEVNVGTSFKIYLPRVNEVAKPGSGSPLVQPIARGTESILLVEDEDGLRGLLHEVLTELGYSVSAAANGLAALHLAKERDARFDLIVTDVVMPGMGGRFMVEQLVTLFPTVKVLYVSGYTDDAIVRHGILHDQVPFLQKPFSPSALARKIREVLDS